MKLINVSKKEVNQLLSFLKKEEFPFPELAISRADSLENGNYRVQFRHNYPGGVATYMGEIDLRRGKVSVCRQFQHELGAEINDISLFEEYDKL